MTALSPVAGGTSAGAGPCAEAWTGTAVTTATSTSATSARSALNHFSMTPPVVRKTAPAVAHLHDVTPIE